MEKDKSVLRGLQILRFIAAIFVVYAHYNFLQIKFGSFGVDIFFVISGFIISLIVSSNPKNFLKKRIARVVPLYLIATMIVFILVSFFPSLFRSTVNNSEALVKSLLFIPYRIGNSGPLLSLGWTLNYEMFFYLLMAFCIFLKLKKPTLPLQCALLTLFIYLFFNTLKSDEYVFRFYGSGLILEFILGIVLFYIWKNYRMKENFVVDIFLIFFSVLALGFMIYSDIYKISLFGNRNLDRGIPSFIVVFGFLAMDKYLDDNSLIVNLFIRLGDASYFTYLFHPFIIFGLTRLLYPIVFANDSHTSIEILKLLLSILIVLYCSLLGYRFLDKPIGNFTRRLLNI